MYHISSYKIYLPIRTKTRTPQNEERGYFYAIGEKSPPPQTSSLPPFPPLPPIHLDALYW